MLSGFIYLIQTQIPFLINSFPDQSNGFSHGKSCSCKYQCQGGNMSQAEESHTGSKKKAGYVKVILTFG